LPHGLAGSVPQVGVPIRMSATPPSPTLPPPLLAEHTARVLRERLGLTDDAITALAEEGVVQVRSP
jgi:crotonobetainyl-CoA:carnitine CoA-transferase CaiB-like acyl-CoA transferase